MEERHVSLSNRSQARWDSGVCVLHFNPRVCLQVANEAAFLKYHIVHGLLTTLT